MRKCVIASAVLGSMVGAAHADSNVTLYGVIDTPIEYATNVGSKAPTVNATTGAISPAGGGTRVSMPASGGLLGSRWGLTGAEDLGGGLKAVFTLESGFGANNGMSLQGGRLFGRQAFVGLKSDTFGRITFGRQYTTMFDAFVNFSPTGYALLYEPLFLQEGTNFREDNVVKYLGSFGGFTAEAHWSFGAGVPTVGVTPLAGSGVGQTAGHFRDDTAYGAALSYAAGPFGATVVYDQWNPAPTAGNAGNAKKLGTAVSFDAGFAKFMAGYRWGDTKTSTGVALTRDDYYWAGAQFRATPSFIVTLAYYYDNWKASRVSAGAPETNPPNPWQAALILDYFLSKRTDVYLTTAYARNAGLELDTVATGYAAGYYPEQGHSGQFGAAIGIRHKF